MLENDFAAGMAEKKPRWLNHRGRWWIPSAV